MSGDADHGHDHGPGGHSHGGVSAAILESLLRDRSQTQLQVAAATGIANSTLSNVLHGKRQLTRDHIRRLAKHFNVNPTVFHG